MNKRASTVIYAALLFFVACSGKKNNGKSVMIMASGAITVTDKTIQLEPGMRHNEQTIAFKEDKVTLTVKSTAGTTKTFDLTDNGVYVLNLQTDTLIGGIVNYGAGGMPGTITSELLDHIIDSTQQLIQGLNASDAKGTYFIQPFTIKKVSDKMNTRVVGTFKGIPYKISEDETGKLPDVIKFFTTKQKRETLTDLITQRAKIKAIH